MANQSRKKKQRIKEMRNLKRKIKKYRKKRQKSKRRTMPKEVIFSEAVAESIKSVKSKRRFSLTHVCRCGGSWSTPDKLGLLAEMVAMTRSAICPLCGQIPLFTLQAFDAEDWLAVLGKHAL